MCSVHNRQTGHGINDACKECQCVASSYECHILVLLNFLIKMNIFEKEKQFSNR